MMPNIALLPALKERFDVSYMGTDGIEKDIVRRSNIPFYEIECPKLVRGSVLKNLSLPLRLFKSVKLARRGLLVIQPDVVFSKGGYVSLPVAIAAKKLKIPVLSHESDLKPGCKFFLTHLKFYQPALYFFPHWSNLPFCLCHKSLPFSSLSFVFI